MGKRGWRQGDPPLPLPNSALKDALPTFSPHCPLFREPMGHPRTLNTEHQEQRQLVRPIQSDPGSLGAGRRGLHTPLPSGDQHSGGEYHQRGVSTGGEHHPEGSTTRGGAHTSVCSENQEVQRLEHMHLLHRQSPVKHRHGREVAWKRKPGYQHGNPRHFPEPRTRLWAALEAFPLVKEGGSSSASRGCTGSSIPVSSQSGERCFLPRGLGSETPSSALVGGKGASLGRSLPGVVPGTEHLVLTKPSCFSSVVSDFYVIF